MKKKVYLTACYCGIAGIKISYAAQERLLKLKKIIIIEHRCANCMDKIIVILDNSVIKHKRAI